MAKKKRDPEQEIALDLIRDSMADAGHPIDDQPDAAVLEAADKMAARVASDKVLNGAFEG